MNTVKDVNFKPLAVFDRPPMPALRTLVIILCLGALIALAYGMVYAVGTVMGVPGKAINDFIGDLSFFVGATAGTIGVIIFVFWTIDRSDRKISRAFKAFSRFNNFTYHATYPKPQIRLLNMPGSGYSEVWINVVEGKFSSRSFEFGIFSRTSSYYEALPIYFGVIAVELSHAYDFLIADHIQREWQRDNLVALNTLNNYIVYRNALSQNTLPPHLDKFLETVSNIMEVDIEIRGATAYFVTYNGFGFNQASVSKIFQLIESVSNFDE